MQRTHGRQSPCKMEKLTEATEIYQKNKDKNFALEEKGVVSIAENLI